MCTPAIFAPEVFWSLFPSTGLSLSLLKLPLQSCTRAPARHLCQALEPFSHLCGIMWSILSQPIWSAPTFSSVFFFCSCQPQTLFSSPLCSIPPVSARVLFLKSGADLSCLWLPVWFGSSFRRCSHIHFRLKPTSMNK